MIEEEIEELIDAKEHLATALVQVIDSDDQIIVGHMRDAHQILKSVIRRAKGMDHVKNN